MILYNPNGTTLADIQVDDNSYRYQAIMGDNSLTLYFSLSEHLEIPIGAYAVFQAVRYTLIRPEALTMKHIRSFEYTVTMEGDAAKAKRWKFLNPIDGRLKFPLTATPREHLQMFVDNMNSRDSGWSIGNCIEGVEKLVSYNHNYCIDALRLMAEQFDTEYETNGKVVSLHKVEYNKDNPLALSYGKGNGFKSGVGRSNSGESLPVEILYVQGGTDNINPATYGSPELLLPKGQTLGYDGNVFSDEAGYVASKGSTYIVSADGLSLHRSDKALDSLAEDSLDCSTIYPKRVGTVSNVQVVDADNNFYDIIDDSIPSNLDYNDYLIAGETMTIIFQSGMLAGREFEVKYIHSERKFEIVPQDMDGQTMPNSTFKPAVGNAYAVFHCALPDAYIRDDASKSGASWDMFREAIRYMYEHEEQQFTFKGELDGIWAKQDWPNIGGKLILGGYIEFSDLRFQPDGVLVRIVGIKDYINNPHSPTIELSNQTVAGGFASSLKEIENEEVATDSKIGEAVQFTKRRFRNAIETSEMLIKAGLENFSGKINPIVVQTMQAIVGDESLQCGFFTTRDCIVSVLNPFTYNSSTKKLSAQSCVLKHYTIGITDVKPSQSRNISEYKRWNMSAFASSILDDPDKGYYIYAKVDSSNDGVSHLTGSFLISETPIGMRSVSGYYHLLLGILNGETYGERSIATLYGYTEILPGQMTTDVIKSSNGNTYFDLLNGIIHGTIQFTSDSTGLAELPEYQRLVEIANGNIQTWFSDDITPHQEGAPTLSNYPANQWITEADRETHVGDLYYSDENKAYRFKKNASISEGYEWSPNVDTDVARALALAQQAKTAADNLEYLKTALGQYDTLVAGGLVLSRLIGVREVGTNKIVAAMNAYADNHSGEHSYLVDSNGRRLMIFAGANGIENAKNAAFQVWEDGQIKALSGVFAGAIQMPYLELTDTRVSEYDSSTGKYILRSNPPYTYFKVHPGVMTGISFTLPAPSSDMNGVTLNIMFFPMVSKMDNDSYSIDTADGSLIKNLLDASGDSAVISDQIHIDGGGFMQLTCDGTYWYIIYSSCCMEYLKNGTYYPINSVNSIIKASAAGESKTALYLVE